VPSAWPEPLNPRSAGERVRPSSRSEDGSDRSQARVGRGAQGALAINPQSTTPMVRRWAATGGPEGRCRGTSHRWNAEDHQDISSPCGRDARTTTLPKPKQLPIPWTRRPGGVPGPALCRLPAPVPASLHTIPYLAPSGKTLFPLCSGSVAGRRRAIGVVASPSINHNRPRRWCDAGPLGRHSVTAVQKAGVDPRTHPAGETPAPQRPRRPGSAESGAVALRLKPSHARLRSTHHEI